MKKNLFLALGLAFSLMAPAWAADIDVENAVVRNAKGNVDFSFVLINRDDIGQAGPIKIHLMSKQQGGNWTEINSWNLENLRAGGSVTETFQGSGINTKGDYEAKVRVEAPLNDPFEVNCRLINE